MFSIFKKWFLLDLNRTVREVAASEQDKTVSDAEIVDILTIVLKAFQDNAITPPSDNKEQEKETNTKIMCNTLGYQVERCNSTIPGAGRGVFVTSGKVPCGSLVALYPGIM